MTRQYIGARYVPKFYENSDGTAAWRSGVIYEALTIVTYNGNSYTSKKTVPASVGNPSANTDYWVATGLFNEQVAALSQRMNTAEQNIDTLTGLVDNVEAEQIVVLADSYGQSRGTGTNPFIDRLQNALPDKRIFKNAAGGRSMAQRPNQEYDTYQTGLQALVASASGLDLSAATDIYIVGLINDSLDTLPTEDVVRAIQSMYNYVLVTFSGKVRIIYVPFGVYLATTNTQRARELYYATEASAMAASGRVTEAWIENAAFVLIRRDRLNSDLLHPSYEGQDALFEFMMRLIRGQRVDVHHHMTLYDPENKEVGSVVMCNGSSVCRFVGNTHVGVNGGAEVAVTLHSPTFPIEAGGRHVVGLTNAVFSGEGVSTVSVPIANVYIENGVLHVRVPDASVIAGRDNVVLNQISIPFTSYII